MTQQNDCAYHFVKDHTSEAFRAMNGMRERHELCDVILKIGDWLSPAHKLVLAATSPYFHAMFTSELISIRNYLTHSVLNSFLGIVKNVAAFFLSFLKSDAKIDEIISYGWKAF